MNVQLGRYIVARLAVAGYYSKNQDSRFQESRLSRWQRHEYLPELRFMNERFKTGRSVNKGFKNPGKVAQPAS
jgi:hypothetical protein